MRQDGGLPAASSWQEDQATALRDDVGPFGTLLYTGHDWADAALSRRSMELMTNEVWLRLEAVTQ
jgi:hypothetical protein